MLKVKGQFIKGQMAIKKNEDEYKGVLSDAEYKQIMDNEIYIAVSSLLKVYFSSINSITISELLANVVTEDQMSIVIKQFRKALSTAG